MDIEQVLTRVLYALLKNHGFRLPVTIACVGSNEAVLFTRFGAAPAGSSPGSVEQEHLAGHIDDEGFAAPIHLMATDATGKSRLALQRGGGPPLVLETVEPRGS